MHVRKNQRQQVYKKLLNKAEMASGIVVYPLLATNFLGK